MDRCDIRKCSCVTENRIRNIPRRRPVPAGNGYSPAAVIISLTYDAEAIPPEIEKLDRAGIVQNGFWYFAFFQPQTP